MPGACRVRSAPEKKRAVGPTDWPGIFAALRKRGFSLNDILDLTIPQLQAELRDYSDVRTADADALLQRRQEMAGKLFRRIEHAYGIDLADASLDQACRLIMLATGEDRKRDAGMVQQDLAAYLKR